MDKKMSDGLRKPFGTDEVQVVDMGKYKADYVGHANVTDRLLEVDPEWTWTPVAKGEDGLPLVELDDSGNPMGLWIELTIGGVTRLGYGSLEKPKPHGNAIKELIGDAIRNAAMRFGVGLDLWIKTKEDDVTNKNAPTGGGKKMTTLDIPADTTVTCMGCGVELDDPKTMPAKWPDKKKRWNAGHPITKCPECNAWCGVMVWETEPPTKEENDEELPF